MVVYLGLLGVAEPRQLSYPGGLVRDVPLVEGGQARGLQAVVGVPVAWGRGGRMVRNLGCHVSKERLATRNSSSNEHPGFPAFHVGAIIASFGAEVPSSALVVGVITKVPAPGGEPVIPAWGHEGFVLDAAEVLTNEGGPVASRIEARCHVVLLVAFVPVGLPPAARLPTSLLVHTPVLWAYWPRMMVARLGQQSTLETKAFEKLITLALSTERVFGMYLRLPFRMYSVKRKFNLQNSPSTTLVHKGKRKAGPPLFAPRPSCSSLRLLHH